MDPKRRNEIRYQNGIEKTKGFNASSGKSKTRSNFGREIETNKETGNFPFRFGLVIMGSE